MSDGDYGAVCGVYCGSCELLDKQCAGCGYVDGSPLARDEPIERLVGD